MKALDFSSGETPLDDHIDMAPRSSHTHFKLPIPQYVTASFGLVVMKESPT